MITRHLRGPALCPGAEGVVEWLPASMHLHQKSLHLHQKAPDEVGKSTTAASSSTAAGESNAMSRARDWLSKEEPPFAT